MKTLNEKGFVFIDKNNRPYWCCIYHEIPMFMYWHEGQKSWVTLREVNQTEIWQANEMKIPSWQAEIYHEQHNKFINQWNY